MQCLKHKNYQCHINVDYTQISTMMLFVVYTLADKMFISV